MARPPQIFVNGTVPDQFPEPHSPRAIRPNSLNGYFDLEAAQDDADISIVSHSHYITGQPE